MTSVTEYLARHKVYFDVLPHKKTDTAQEEASSIGAAPHDVVKTVVAMTSNGPALLAVPASRRLDMKLVRGALQDRDAHLASEDEISALLPDFELGAIPPLPTLTGMRMYVDPEVMDIEAMIIPAGISTLSVRGRRDDIIGDEPISRIVPLVRHEDELEY